MVYKDIVNKELRIAAIHIDDLDLKYVKSFLEQWEEGAKLKELTLYYDYENDYLVLNMDHKYYEHYLRLTEAFLSADYESSMAERHKVINSLKETVEVLATCKRYRRIKKELSIIGMQPVVGFADTYIGKIFTELQRGSDSATYNMSAAFNYGYICGKRAERARRKK